MQLSMQIKKVVEIIHVCNHIIYLHLLFVSEYHDDINCNKHCSIILRTPVDVTSTENFSLMGGTCMKTTRDGSLSSDFK